MKKILFVVALTLIFSSAFAAKEQYAMLKCDKDAYTSLLSPDTNYGQAIELDSQTKFSYNGTTYSNRESRISYFHYAIPSELIGKVKVIDAVFYVYVSLYKQTTPYKAGKAIYYAGLYPCMNSWDENTITFNNSPNSSGPSYFELDSATGDYKPFVGYNQFKLPKYGIQLLQKAANTGSYYGMALYVDVSGPSETEPLLVGDYSHLLRIVSKEVPKKMSYVTMGYEVITGNMINGSNINTATLGEVKAKYH
jgi:hypothetical protein